MIEYDFIAKVRALNGRQTNFMGSEGDDFIFADGPGATLLMGKSGDDRLTTPTNGLVKDIVYGDNPVINQAKQGFGVDILDGGPNDHLKSGVGAALFSEQGDLYWIHGPGFADAPTEVWLNPINDQLIMSGEVSVKSATYTAVLHDQKRALVRDVMLVGDSENRITDNQHVLMHLDTRREADMPRIWIDFDGGNPGLDDARDWWATVADEILL